MNGPRKTTHKEQLYIKKVIYNLTDKLGYLRVDKIDNDIQIDFRINGNGNKSLFKGYLTDIKKLFEER
jgi:hypothetical protein